MVYCNKCGRENEEGTKFCVNCGASLIGTERRAKNTRDECFGLPSGGSIFGLFFGSIIILLGLNEVFDWQVDIGNFAIITFGLLIVVGAIYQLTKRR